MAVSTDIVQSWRRPRGVMRRHLDRPRSEPWAFSLLVAFLLIVFIAQAPYLSRLSFYQPEVPMTQRMVAAGLALMASIPAWYLLAALGHLVARAFGGRGGWYGARLALFWALLAVSPLMLFQGLLAGLAGPSPGLTAVGIVTAAGFLWLWAMNLVEAEG